IYLVPTDSIGQTYLDLNADPERRERLRPLVTPFVAASRDRLMRAARKGVKIAAGSDMYYALPGKTRGQASLLNLQAYAGSGLTSKQILRAAPVDAAALLGLADRAGRLTPGAFADIIAVDADPLAEIGTLQHVRFVMKNGDVIKP